MNTQRVLATFLVAVLAASVFSLVGLASPLQKAHAQAVTIETSADDFGGTFFGEGVLQVVISDPSADDDDTREEITVTIDADPETGAGGSGTFTVPETSTSSGRFEFFLVQEDANEVSNAEIDPINTAGVQDYDGAGNEAPIIEFGSTGDLDVESSLFEETSFDITVGNVEISVDYDEMDAQLNLDRETYGTDSRMYILITDNDANLNPTAVDSFTVAEANLTNTSTDLFTILGGTFVDDVTFTETGDNTAVFEAIIQLTEADSGTDDEFDFTAESVQMTLHDKAEYSNVVGGNNTSTATSQLSFEIDDADGEFDDIGAVTFASELKLTLRDADRNIDSETDDTIDNAVVVSVVNTGGDDETLDMEETGDNTGVFVIDLSNGELRITFLSDGEEPTDNNGILELREDDITEDITIQYTDPSEGEVTSFLTVELTLQTGRIDLPETTGINDDFTLTLTDADLNDNPRTRDSYVITFDEQGGTGSFLNLFNLTRGGEQLGLLANFEIEVEGDPVDFGNLDESYTLTETGINTGIFTASIDMEDIAQNGDNGNPLDLDDGDQVEITYNDLMGTTTRESSDEISVGRASVGVDFSRTTLPIPPQTDGDTIDLLGSGTVVTTFSVTDPDENDQSNVEDDIPFTLASTGANTFEIEIETDAGTLVIDAPGDYTGSNIPGTTSTLADLLGPIADLTLEETGRTTGVFEVELEFDDTTGVALNDWHNMEITFTYRDSQGEEESAGITFRGNDGSLIVDQNSAKAGTILTITVEDQDLNLDDSEVEEFEGTTSTTDYLVSVETEDDEIPGTSTETFRETGPDTGIFTAEYEVGTDIPVTELANDEDEVDQATNILITYNDEIDSTGGSGDEIEVNVPVVSATGSIQVTPELVGPGTELTILIIDSDLDQDSSGTDDYSPPSGQEDTDNFFVSFRSDRSEVNEASPDIEETGPNTGVFEFTLELRTDEGACEDDDMSDFEAEGGSEPSIGACPGDLISIRYEDQQTADGRSSTVSQVIEVRSWDPEFVADKPEGYSVGDRVTITISDPDANRDPDIADSLTDIRVFSTSDAIGEELSALETGKNTGVFRLSFTVSSDTASGAINVRQGDRVTIEYTDEYPADFQDEEEDKEFQYNINIAGRTGRDATTPSAPELRDVTGRELSSLSVGQQAVLSTTVANNNDEPRPFVALVEVRDGSGITVFLAWQTGTLNPNGQAEVGLSWTPEDAGDYEVRTFVISDLQNPQILSDIATSDITVSG